MKKREVRFFKVENLKVEQRSDSVGPKITGYAAVFNKMSEDLGGFREKIKPGAFKKALGRSDVRGLFNHDSNYILGRQSAGTLTLKEDKTGLYMEIDPPDTQIIRDLVLSPINRGDIKEQSFGFIVKNDKWDGIDKEEKEVVRTILEVDELFDVSPVTFPAYPDTSVALRRLEDAKKPAFTEASDDDILRTNVLKYVVAETNEIKQDLAFDMVEMLFPVLTDEQRSQLTPTLEPDGETTENGEGILTGNEEGANPQSLEAQERAKQTLKRFEETYIST